MRTLVRLVININFCYKSQLLFIAFPRIRIVRDQILELELE